MTLTKEDIKFDPGFIIHLQAFIPTVEDIYSKFSNFKNFSQKRNMFKIYYSKLKTLLDSYIGFYLGCIIWAALIKKEEGQSVIGNLCYGGTYDEDTLYEVNFVIDFAKQLERDAKYYMNETYKVKDFELDILNKYKEFLILNEGFVKCNKTDDIKLPENVKMLSAKDSEIAEKTVKSVVENGNFTEFYKIKDMIL